MNLPMRNNLKVIPLSRMRRTRRIRTPRVPPKHRLHKTEATPPPDTTHTSPHKLSRVTRLPRTRRARLRPRLMILTSPHTPRRLHRSSRRMHMAPIHTLRRMGMHLSPSPRLLRPWYRRFHHLRRRSMSHSSARRRSTRTILPYPPSSPGTSPTQRGRYTARLRPLRLLPGAH